jgi:hypothetical protein
VISSSVGILRMVFTCHLYGSDQSESPASKQ